ncbi:C1 family peptidase [Nocardioides sp. Root140]|uniref:C1 family peptidase n=1 Tax=Nocardioides sp. Root140 TaxID=1736460 RepID=UPI0009EAAD57|nr:C1 family peptidase [Nocardioides sp. Root140]
MTTNPDTDHFVCNVLPSTGTTADWNFDDSRDAGALGAPAALPASIDLRESWWGIHDQESTGSCVGWATADGVARWHLVKARKATKTLQLSARHVWMASKETDEFTTRPQSFIEEAGTSLKAALDVARKQGVAREKDLPFHLGATMFPGRENVFYASCARRKISAYYNLRLNLTHWKTWLAEQGPILAAFLVDESWDNATATNGKVDTFKPNTVRGGHAIAIVGYRSDGRFIARNSWGTSWGDDGFAYLKPAYIRAAFYDEAYGVSI